MELWQLKNKVTNENLNQPQPLPNNWESIFGMDNVKDRLGDLSWLGEQYKDLCWVKVGEVKDPTSSLSELEWNRAKIMLAESDWSMLPDVILTKQQKADWIEYRRQLREIKLQSGFPDEIVWPKRPD